MAEWWSTALGAIVLLVSYTVNCAVYFAFIAAYLLTLAVWPITALYGLALTVFAPVIYLVQFALAPLYFALAIIPKLEPLYIFFGCAAFVGIVAGAMLRVSSTVFASILGINGTDSTDEDGGLFSLRRTRNGSMDPKRLTEDEPSSQESEPLWGDARLEKTVMSNTSRRRVPGLLLRETIHEEEDDSL